MELHKTRIFATARLSGPLCSRSSHMLCPQQASTKAVN